MKNKILLFFFAFASGNVHNIDVSQIHESNGVTVSTTPEDSIIITFDCCKDEKYNLINISKNLIIKNPPEYLMYDNTNIGNVFHVSSSCFKPKYLVTIKYDFITVQKQLNTLYLNSCEYIYEQEDILCKIAEMLFNKIGLTFIELEEKINTKTITSGEIVELLNKVKLTIKALKIEEEENIESFLSKFTEELNSNEANIYISDFSLYTNTMFIKAAIYANNEMDKSKYFFKAAQALYRAGLCNGDRYDKCKLLSMSADMYGTAAQAQPCWPQQEKLFCKQADVYKKLYDLLSTRSNAENDNLIKAKLLQRKHNASIDRVYALIAAEQVAFKNTNKKQYLLDAANELRKNVADINELSDAENNDLKKCYILIDMMYSYLLEAKCIYYHDTKRQKTCWLLAAQTITRFTDFIKTLSFSEKSELLNNTATKLLQIAITNPSTPEKEMLEIAHNAFEKVDTEQDMKRANEVLKEMIDLLNETIPSVQSASNTHKKSSSSTYDEHNKTASNGSSKYFSSDAENSQSVFSKIIGWIKFLLLSPLQSIYNYFFSRNK